ncbi:MAG: bifunctional 2-polyprenyl-6-hydroxyphenol methylase/3-demethylubiquinol 3-O-methyltransferase UbiG [Desulfobacteraceae bacterium]|nr:bifunctional 2-polyprenyl-6-hydroxyphenol methylase/3-demethylubiquinol 3-O-methyltransferase UbiG [Desulfobacteraceae bacterium]
MRINNEIYETYGDCWWNDNAGFDFSSLRYCVNPVRYAYFQSKLSNMALAGGTVLDIGCGGGFLAEEFAKDGFAVTGIDPSGRSIEAARKHAAESGLGIQYQVGRGEALPFGDGSFDIIACCDVLEHVDDLKQVAGEIGRLLKPGGVFFYDTVNRTFLSKLVLIKIWQDWGIIRSSQSNVHVWEKFIKPDELVRLIRDCGLVNLEMKGISPKRRNPFAMLGTLRALSKGKIRNEDLAERLGLHQTDDLNISYMGFALKQ